MKKLTSILLICTMLLALATPVFASKRGGLAGYIPHLKENESITVDGSMDSAYASAFVTDICQSDGRNTTYTGTRGIAYMLWSEGKVYTYVRVFDDEVISPLPQLQLVTPWITDSFEIFFDLGNEQTQPIVHARVDHTGYGSFYLEDESVNVNGTQARAYFDYAASSADDGYAVELCVDLSTYADIEEGMEIGLNLMINDMTSANTSDRTAIYYMPSKLEVRDWWKDCYDYVILGSENINDSALEIQLDTKELSLGIAQLAQLTATVYTETGSHQNVKWTSTHPHIASVSESGLVVAKAIGQTIITATSPDGTKNASCIVSVSGNARYYEAPYGTPTVDGFISTGEWENAPEGVMDVLTNPGKTLGIDPIMRIMHDGTYMYVLVEAVIPDDKNNTFVCVHVPHAGCKLDGCQSYIKLVVDGNSLIKGATNPVWTYQMDSNRDGANDFSIQNNGGKSNIATAAYSFNGEKYIVEIKIAANYGNAIPTGPASVDVRFDSDAVWATHQWAYQQRIWAPAFNPATEGGTVYFLEPGEIPSETGDTVIKVELDRTELPMNIAEVKKLTATVHTRNGSYHDVIWTSSNPNVATVSEDGTVVAKAYGTTSVKATSLDGKKMAICIVSVSRSLRYDTTFGTSTIDGVISEGEWDGVATAVMANKTNPGYALPSDPTMKIKNDDTHMYVLIEAETPDADNDIFVCVHVPHENCDPDTCESYIKIVVDGEDVLAGKKNPVWTYNMDADRDGESDFADGTNGGKSDLARVAYSFNNGKFIAEIKLEANYGVKIPAGAASVDVRIDGNNSRATHQWAYQLRTWDPTFSPRYDGGTVYFDVREVTVPVTDVELDKTTLTLDIDEQAALTATVTPENATVKGVKWHSSNESVAEVSEDGTVTAKRPGTTTVTATTADGGLTATCTVTVTNILYTADSTVIGELAYEGRTELTDVAIADGMVIIGFRAFKDCTNLTSITIPASVMVIGPEAFVGCKNLTIYGYKDSIAESYAADNGIPFVQIVDTVVCADLTADGTVDSSDLQYLSNHLGRASRYPLPDGTSADYTNDGSVDSGDLQYLSNHIGRPSRYPIPKAN